MKSTGIVRSIDNLGRIVIPMEIRRKFDIHTTDPMEIYTDGDSIVLKKYQSGCIFCGETEGIEKFQGKNVCHKCRRELAR